MGPNCTVIVRMYEEMSVGNVKLDQEVKEELEGHRLEPADILARNLPALNELEHVPAIFNDDADTLTCKHIHINA